MMNDIPLKLSESKLEFACDIFVAILSRDGDFNCDEAGIGE